MTERKTLKELDINKATFYALYGIDPILESINGRVVFTFPICDDLYRLMDNYNSNVSVPVLDFVTQLKALRGQMLTLRGAKQ